MKFYFCEGCNKRITEADLAAGLGRDKQVKGVFCADCASGVNTIEFQPLTGLDAEPPPPVLVEAPQPVHRRVAGKTPAHARPTTATLRAPSDSKTKHSRARGSARGLEVESPQAKPDSKVMLIGACSGGVVLLGLIMAYALSGGPVKPKDAENDKRDSVQAAPANIPKSTVAPITVPPPAAAQAPNDLQTRHEKPPSETPIAIQARTDDDMASKSFDAALKKINALSDDKLAERMAVAQAFLNQYPDAMEASRMRVKMNDWRKPPEPAPAPAPSPSDTQAAKPDVAAAAPSGDTKILFTCNPATPADAEIFKSCEREQMDVFGTKGVAVKADAVPDPPWHSTIMNINFDGRPTPVKISSESWFRFACRLEKSCHIMVHCFTGDGFYETHLNDVKQDTWVWVVVKCSEFQRNMRGPDTKPKPGSEVHGIVLYGGNDKIPCNLYVGEFSIGEGAIPKD